MNYKQIYAIKAVNEKRIKEACPGVPEKAGIYILSRIENGFKLRMSGRQKTF